MKRHTVTFRLALLLLVIALPYIAFYVADPLGIGESAGARLGVTACGAAIVLALVLLVVAVRQRSRWREARRRR